MPNSDKIRAVNIIEWDKLSDAEIQRFIAAKQRVLNMGLVNPDDDSIGQLEDIRKVAERTAAIRNGDASGNPLEVD